MSSHLLSLAHSELTGPRSANIPKYMNECPAFIRKNRDTSLSPGSPRPTISFGHIRSNLLEKKKCFLFSFLFPVRKWSPKAMLSLSATQSCHTHGRVLNEARKLAGAHFACSVDASWASSDPLSMWESSLYSCQGRPWVISVCIYVKHLCLGTVDPPQLRCLSSMPGAPMIFMP